ncbi:hypothetical protein [Lactiplantibacillus carotarum]|uniref:hypothetical protein n=1 Tax=Lactiplantibacillus carotarum TaxID=2993456 RepID=UPI00298F2EBD|nr:hypothetical protein [Lactiplantibacillus carotarum]
MNKIKKWLFNGLVYLLAFSFGFALELKISDTYDAWKKYQSAHAPYHYIVPIRAHPNGNNRPIPY